MEQRKDNKILLHACCGICSAHPINYLREAGYDVSVYFYNPNIFPREEYLKRLEAERILCKKYNVELIEGDYRPEDFQEAAKGLENEPEKGKRCDKCFELRLRKTAEKALGLKIEKFTTSIVISPHKNYEKLTEIGTRIAQETNLTYIGINFRKNDGFLKTNKISKELNLYRQHYCGCQYSIRPEVS